MELAGTGGTGFGSYTDAAPTKTPPAQKKRLVRRSASKDKDDLLPPLGLGQQILGSPLPVTKTASPSSTSFANQPPQALHLAKPPASAPSNQPQFITKLGTHTGKKATAAAVAPKPKPQEDDIFASFGLSAQPTFGATKKTATAEPAKTRYAAQVDDVDFGPADDDWGDDADLDDLLND